MPLLAAAGLVGCGEEQSLAPSPPATIVTARIVPERVTVRPGALPAGPIVLLIANRTSRPQSLTLEARTANGTRLRQTSTPINPSGTARVELDVPVGTYELRTAEAAIAPADLVVRPRVTRGADESA